MSGLSYLRKGRSRSCIFLSSPPVDSSISRSFQDDVRRILDPLSIQFSPRIDTMTCDDGSCLDVTLRKSNWGISLVDYLWITVVVSSLKERNEYMFLNLFEYAFRAVVKAIKSSWSFDISWHCVILFYDAQILTNIFFCVNDMSMTFVPLDRTTPGPVIFVQQLRVTWISDKMDFASTVEQTHSSRLLCVSLIQKRFLYDFIWVVCMETVILYLT